MKLNYKIIDLIKKFSFFSLFLLLFACQNSAEREYIDPQGQSIATRIILPDNYQAIEYPKDSYEYFVQNLKVKENGAAIYLYDGSKKFNQLNHLAIIDYDIGKVDLQQCADALIRIKAEYLFSQKRYDEIKFHLTNGFLFEYSKYQEGYRLQVKDNTTWLEKTANPDNSYEAFRTYLDDIFMYAGTLSVLTESKNVKIEDIKPGMFFIDEKHVVIVVNVIENNEGAKAFLVAQSYMPAQSIHILKNPSDNGAWYYTKNFAYPLITPEWRFSKDTLMEFK